MITTVNGRRIQTYPNQKVVAINKIKNSNEILYFYSNHEAANIAMKELTHGALKLWLYLNMNQHGYEMALSSIDVQDKTGTSGATYKRAVNELIKKRFLVCKDENSNHYDFYEKKSKDQSETRQPNTNHNDCNADQKETRDVYQNDELQYQNNGHQYQSDDDLYQDDTRNITDKTKRKNNTSYIISEEEDLDCCNGYKEYEPLSEEEQPF